MTAKHTVKLTANFERNLTEIEAFLMEAEAPQAFDALLDELLDTTIPNLERFPGMGRLFLERPARSVEVANGIACLTQQLGSLAKDGELREYVMTHYLLLYARIKGTVYLLSIRHQRQLSFDFQALWLASS
ncbi:MAG: type II toxin-antitoxin system RelE/ParE family toxin [Proteobacteria bacterium]|nr:type II toxin-antitoxin system RelE/ParE family toxin [Pseudomonadota bacterium]MBS0495162.1 type II toxin-antitoxin system RelE/ParE family toxin [Pseudomonadota bacterium]